MRHSRQVRIDTVRVPWPLTVPLPVWLSDPNPPWHCTPLTQSYLPPKPDILFPSCPQPYRPVQNSGFSKHTLGFPPAPQPVLSCPACGEQRSFCFLGQGRLGQPLDYIFTLRGCAVTIYNLRILSFTTSSLDNGGNNLKDNAQGSVPASASHTTAASL